MDRQRPARAWSRPWLAMSAAAWLAACQGLPQLSLSDPPPAPGWRVIERLGEARYLAPGMAGWEQIAAGSMVPAGSQIATGIGGRLIVHQAANQLSAGTGSRFILPGWEPGDSVRQTAGWLRYRIVTAPTAAFGIETPFLDLEVDDAVLDVTVRESDTEVAVVSGRVRVKTLDERRQIDLHAGYTGYASLQSSPLLVHRGPGQNLEPVSPIVVPALHPHRPAGASVVPDPAGSDATAMAAFAGRTLAAGDPPVPSAAQQPGRARAPVHAASATPAAAAAASPAALPAAATLPPGRAAASDAPRPLVGASLEQAPLAASKVEPAEEIRRRFDALTEGLLEGLMPVLPQSPRRDGR